jgi:hypothetical protein
VGQERRAEVRWTASGGDNARAKPLEVAPSEDVAGPAIGGRHAVVLSPGLNDANFTDRNRLRDCEPVRASIEAPTIQTVFRVA